MDIGLVGRALNYHGVQLKKAWEAERGEGDLEKLNVENIDYNVFQERQKNISFQERGRRLKLCQFVANHANMLFDEVLNVRTPSTVPKSPPAAPADQLAAVLPPLDVFLEIDKKEKTEHFFNSIRPGDLILGSLTTKLSTGYLMKVVCTDGVNSHIVSDLGIKAIIHSMNMIPAVDKKGVTRSFLLNDLVCCEVLEVVTTSEKMYAGMKGDICSPSDRQRLGLIHSEDMPLFYN